MNQLLLPNNPNFSQELELRCFNFWSQDQKQTFNLILDLDSGLLVPVDYNRTLEYAYDENPEIEEN